MILGGDNQVIPIADIESMNKVWMREVGEKRGETTMG
jgi:hypothetical protein